MSVVTVTQNEDHYQNLKKQKGKTSMIVPAVVLVRVKLIVIIVAVLVLQRVMVIVRVVMVVVMHMATATVTRITNLTTVAVMVTETVPQ